MNERHIDDNELHAYVDGVLPAERRAAVEAYLAANPDAAQRVDGYRTQNTMLRSAFDPILSEPVPAGLGIRPRSAASPWLRHAGIAAALVVAAALGWFARGPVFAPVEFDTGLAQRAVLAHRVYAPEVLHPVEISARQEEHLVQWLSKRLHTPVRAPRLVEAGFDLVGGRLLPDADANPAAQFMYENAEGRRLTLYVATHRDGPRETAFRYNEDNGVHTFYWIEGALGYALTGEIERAQLLRVAEAVYRDLNR